ncbi:hypothetical protein ACFXO9_35060 [Nocardia tengchongensis]|uniref:hypothetical protein n=1 Tax=Nocardia tengchongensis TaxID=2055889 RepID=UPI003683F034
MAIEGEWPKRSEVESVWRRMLVGDLTREAAHDWAKPWVEGADVGTPTDAMASLGLDYLHGLDMTASLASPNLIYHGGAEPYVLSELEVAARLDYWLVRCREYDSLYDRPPADG